MDLIEVGQKVKHYRKDKKLTQADLARAARVSRARLEALENGRIGEIGVRTLMRILNAANLDLRLTEQNLDRPTLEDLRAERTG